LNAGLDAKPGPAQESDMLMLRWLTVLFVLAMITFVLGFTTLFGNPVGMARTLFKIYCSLAGVTLAVGILRR
jgi:uncharacterized membrane protein YtjA (UPF0391 family)